MKFFNTGDSRWQDTVDSKWNLTDPFEISVGEASVTVTGQKLDVPIAIANAFVTVTGHGVVLPVNIGTSSVSYTGQSLTIPINIGTSTVTYSGQSLTLPVNVPAGSVAYLGQSLAIQVTPTFLIGTAQITYTGKGFGVLVYERVKKFEPVELIPPYRPEPGHEPCAYWPSEQSDEPVWAFEEQFDLPIPYHKHPIRAEICGHWHKQRTFVERPGGEGSCIEYVDESTVPYNAISSGLYASNKGLFYHTDGFLYGASGSSGYIFRMDPDTLSITESTLFSGSAISAFKQIIYHNGYIWALIERSGYTGNWIQRIVMPAIGSGNDFTLLGDPLYGGDVVVGSDGNNYGCKGDTYYYNTGYAPITGSNWSDVWELLPADYGYVKTASYAAFGGRATIGAKMIDFQFAINGNLIFNGGPSSSILVHWSRNAVFTTSGTYVAIISGVNYVGPNELVLNPTGQQVAQYRCTSAFSNLTLKMIDPITIIKGDYLVTGLLDENDSPRDNSIYHYKTVWHTNNRIYNFHSCWSDQMDRIIAMDPYSYDVKHQYIFGDGGSTGSFIILGDYIYAWQQVLTETGHASSIAKLTLDLELVCVEQCLGRFTSLYTELGAQLATDGVQYLFNYDRSSVIKYKVRVEGGSESDHDPTWDADTHGPWDFEKVDW